MGVTVNTVKTQIQNQTLQASQLSSNNGTGLMKLQTTNSLTQATSNINAGAKMCPVISEGRDIIGGIVKGDFNLDNVNSALVGAYFLMNGAAAPLYQKMQLN